MTLYLIYFATENLFYYIEHYIFSLICSQTVCECALILSLSTPRTKMSGTPDAAAARTAQATGLMKKLDKFSKVHCTLFGIMNVQYIN